MWRQGDAEAALGVFQPQQATNVSFERVLRRWIGRILLELKRPTEAERYWRSLGSSRWAQLELATLRHLTSVVQE